MDMVGDGHSRLWSDARLDSGLCNREGAAQRDMPCLDRLALARSTE
jgi:hypothetical protein